MTLEEFKKVLRIDIENFAVMWSDYGSPTEMEEDAWFDRFIEYLGGDVRE